MFTLVMIKLIQRVKIHIMRHNINNMWLLVLLLLMFASCENCITEEWQDGDLPSTGSSSLILKVKTPLVDDVTRAIGAAGSDDAGDKMNTLLVVLVNGSDKIVGCKVVSNFVDNTQKEAVIQFDNLAVATYSVYLIANYESVTTVKWNNYVAGNTNTIDKSFKDALVGSLTGTNTPSFEKNGMPMTATLTTTLQHGTNTVSAELERVVARFGVNVHNHVVEDYKVVISNVNLSSFNVSDTYLFNHDNELPNSVNYREFFKSATESVYAPAGISVPFDAYIYETNDNALYNLSMAIAVFNTNATKPPTLKNIYYSISDGNNYTITGDKKYLLYNRGSKQYLYVNGNKQLAFSDNVNLTGNYDNYLWDFSSTSSGTIRNVGTGLYIVNNNANLTLGAEGSLFTFGVNDSSFYIRSQYQYYWGVGYTYYYFIGNNTSSLVNILNSTVPNSDNQRWYLRDIVATSTWSQDPIASIVIDNLSLTYDDEGYVKPLKQIKRNENIQVGVNVFYNPQDGYFSFEVMKWNEKNEGNVTFD